MVLSQYLDIPPNLARCKKGDEIYNQCEAKIRKAGRHEKASEKARKETRKGRRWEEKKRIKKKTRE